MRLLQFAQAFYLCPDSSRPSPQTAAAGPFRSSQEAALWLVLHYEERLTDAQRTKWAELLELAGGEKADPWHLVGLLTYASQGKLTMGTLRKMANVRGT